MEVGHSPLSVPNLRINKRTGPASHPNIWKFIELIQEQEFLAVQVRFAGLSQGILKIKGRNKSDMARDLQILKAKNKYLQSSKFKILANRIFYYYYYLAFFITHFIIIFFSQ